jgi:hypothetical protein
MIIRVAWAKKIYISKAARVCMTLHARHFIWKLEKLGWLVDLLFMVVMNAKRD